MPEIKAQGVQDDRRCSSTRAGRRSSYTTSTNTSLANSALNGPDILDVVTRLDSEFDVVVSGHSHSFTNLLVTNNGGKKILVTQAFSASTAYGDIDLTIDPVTKDVVTKSAKIVTTFADVAPGQRARSGGGGAHDCGAETGSLRSRARWSASRRSRSRATRNTAGESSSRRHHRRLAKPR